MNIKINKIEVLSNNIDLKKQKDNKQKKKKQENTKFQNTINNKRKTYTKK